MLVKLYRNQDGRKEFPGVLTGYDEATGDVTITVGKQEMTFAKKDIALVRLRVEFYLSAYFLFFEFHNKENH